MAALAVVSAAGSPPPEQPSAARAHLAAAVVAVKTATAALTAAAEPTGRLSRLIAGHAAADAELARHRAEDDRHLGEWLAGGGEGRRPAPSLETLACERRVAGLARDAAAARAIIPTHEEAQQRAAQAVRRAQTERDGAVFEVAAECGLHFIETVLRERIREAMEAEALAVGLALALTEASYRNGGGPDDTRPLTAAAPLNEAIRQERQAAQAVADVERGKRLLRALASDPNADL
jgi:hypothetical protein